MADGLSKDPKFDIRYEGRAILKFSPKESPADILNYIRVNKLRGRLEINFPGNGGMASIQFEEIRKVVPE